MTGPSTKDLRLWTCPACGELVPANEPHECAAALDRTAHGGESQEAPPVIIPESVLGTIIGDRYEILQLINHGGMGMVYKARHVVLGSELAVKILLEPQDNEAQRRFMQEARLTSQLRHPNIVYIFDFGVLPDGRSYLVMEYLHGPTLSEVLTGGRLDPLRACQIAAQIAKGLQAVHDHGIVHRDLKPANIFLLEEKNSRDFVKIVDFGIAYSIAMALDRESAERAQKVRPHDGDGPHAGELAEAVSAAALQARQTLPGTLLGTPHYMAPEQVEGQEGDVRSDQYSLGCILYEMLTGRPPFTGKGLREILAKHTSAPPVSPRSRCPEANLSDALEALVLRTLAKVREERFPSMQELAQALEAECEALLVERGLKTTVSVEQVESVRRRSLNSLETLKPLPPPPPPPLWTLGRKAALGGLLVLVVGVGGLAMLRRRPPPPLLAVAVPPPPSEPQLDDLRQLRMRALGILQLGLQDADPELRIGALAALGQTQAPEVARPVAVVLLNDGNPEVQAQAAITLGQLGGREALAALKELAGRTQAPNVLVAVAVGLEQLGDESGRQLLRKALDAPKPDVRHRAAFVLAGKGDERAAALLLAVLASNKLSPSAKVIFLAQLARAGDAGALERLHVMLAPPTAIETRLLVAAKLAEQDDEAGAALLRELAGHPGPHQLAAARLLAAPDEPGPSELFRQLLREPQTLPAARLLATEGLGMSGALADLPLLIPFLGTNHEARQRQGAALAILQIMARDPRATSEQSLTWAHWALSDDNWLIRQTAAEVLGDVTDRQALPLLSGLLQDGEARVRSSAARALGRRHEHDALVALRDGLHDGSEAVREQSLRSIAMVGLYLIQHGVGDAVKEIGGWFQDLMQHGSDREQLVASAALLRLGEDTQRERLRRFLTASDVGLRVLLVQEAAQDRELLRQLLTDDDRAVRTGAALRLAALGDRKGVPILREVLAQGGSEAIGAYGALRALGEEAALPADAWRLLGHGTLEQRLAVVDASELLPVEMAVKMLRRAARDGQPEVRRRAAEVAGRLPAGPGGSPGEPVLRVLALDPDATVRIRAMSLLATLNRLVPTSTEPAPRSEVVPPPAPPPEPPAAPSERATEAAPAEAAHVKESKRSRPGAAVAEEGDADRSVSPAAQAVQDGIGLFDRKQYDEARAALERAKALCARESAAQCRPLGYEISTRLGRIYEEEQRYVDAISEIDKLRRRAAELHLSARQKSALQATVQRLAGHVGQVVVPVGAGSRCRETVVWLPPGQQSVGVQGEARAVLVHAGESIRLGSCK